MNITIDKLREETRKAGRSFIYNPDEERDDEKQTAHFYFVGKDESKEVVFNAFIMTLEYDYHLAVMEEAEEKMSTLHPSLAGKFYEDFTEAEQDKFDEVMDEVYDQGLVKVQERVDLFESDASGELEMEVSLNVKEINDQVIEKFIKEFNSDTLELDDRTYSFEMLDDEE
jgi:folate-dependent phosphoribosylglycinamide formyltransferase PurN